VIYPFVSPKESFDKGRISDRVPSVMGIQRRGYDFVEKVAPVEGDILLPKKHPSAFFGTPLASYLIEAGVDTLVVTGVTTSGCIRATVIDAFSYNFRAVVPHEAVYDRSQISHAVNLFDMAAKYADVVSVAELREQLKKID
jgi:isochorismate hydrolase